MSGDHQALFDVCQKVARFERMVGSFTAEARRRKEGAKFFHSFATLSGFALLGYFAVKDSLNRLQRPQAKDEPSFKQPEASRQPPVATPISVHS